MSTKKFKILKSEDQVHPKIRDLEIGDIFKVVRLNGYLSSSTYMKVQDDSALGYKVYNSDGICVDFLGDTEVQLYDADVTLKEVLG